jgi:XTP/dITP diphosphohydrolase
MTSLIFATNNKHKVQEIRSVLGDRFHIIPLSEAGIKQDIPEPHDTLEENATEKATFIHRLTGGNCFSEDSGLEVNALAGAPGVRSARYAGNDADASANIRKLLEAMDGEKDRSARFRTVISLIINGKEYLFEGVCPGSITLEIDGSGGFGYDPVFIPEGADRTFAQMTTEQKNLFSHRRKAVDKMISFLLENR